VPRPWKAANGRRPPDEFDSIDLERSSLWVGPRRGANRSASSFIQLLNAYASQQQRVIAVLDEDAAMIGRAISGIQILGAPHELEAIVSEFAIHGIGTNRIVL